MSRNPLLVSAGTLLLDALAQVTPEWLDANIPGRKGGSDTVDAETSAHILALLKETYPVVFAAGGSAANTVSALASWGTGTRIIGMIGDDESGVFCADSLRRSGADVSSVRRHAVLPTGRCISMVTPDSERTMRTFLGASDKLMPEELTSADFDGADFLLFEGYLLYHFDLSIRLFELAGRYGVPMGFDLASFELVSKFRDRMPSLLRRCAVLFANREEAEALFGPGSDDMLLERLADFAPAAVLKRGKDGALIRMNGSVFRIAAEDADAVDTTGAGDLWQAGFLYGYLRGQPPELCGRFGAAAAAELVRIPGARLPLETLNRLKEKFTTWEKKA